jgi:hypothetical protein
MAFRSPLSAASASAESGKAAAGSVHKRMKAAAQNVDFRARVALRFTAVVPFEPDESTSSDGERLEQFLNLALAVGERVESHADLVQ